MAKVSPYLLSHSEEANFSQMRSSLGQCLFLRVIVLLVVLSASVLEVQSNLQLNATIWLIATSISITLLQVLLLKTIRHIYFVAYTQFLTDVGLATATIAITGSLITFSLYLLVIVAAATTLRQHGAVIIAAASGITYALLAGDIIPTVLPNETLSALPSMAIVYVMLVFIALLSAKFTRQLEIMDTLASRRVEELESLSLRHSLLFEDISNGVISVDADATILKLNRSARRSLEFFGSEESKPVGENLYAVLESMGVESPQQLLEVSSEFSEPRELTLLTYQSKQEKHLQYSIRPVTSADGVSQGLIIIFDDVSDLRNIEEKLLVHERMTRLLTETNPVHIAQGAHLSIIGESQIMNRVFELVDRVAKSDASVLITGESGTGKELIAQAIHRGSSRKNKPFIAINCGAIPENLIESELFGHTKGAFTGAIVDAPGLFREAHGGTIFLDEIGELPIAMQAKLLRVLQERVVRAVGSSKDVAIDVRIIAATNRNLAKAIKSGGFREDLFYRINVINIPLPSLSQRREDIPLLVRHFITKYSDPDRTYPQISPEALQMLVAYNYPGNVRELENIVERAIVLDGSAILPEHLPTEVQSTVGKPIAQPTAELLEQTLNLPLALEEILSQIEQRYLNKAMQEAEGVKTKAAELLGLNFRSFRYRLKKYGLGPAETDDHELSE